MTYIVPADRCFVFVGGDDVASIYISSTKGDGPAAKAVADHLTQAGHRVTSELSDAALGDNIFDKLSEKISISDIVIVLLSRRSLGGVGTQEEYSFISFAGLIDESKSVINLLIEPVTIPTFLSRFPIVDMTADVHAGWRELDLTIAAHSQPKRRGTARRQSGPGPITYASTDYRRQIDQLRASLQDGRLTLVCGAGVSVDANVPDWSGLLADLLVQALAQIAKSHPSAEVKISTKDFERRYSNLIMAKYLKLNLGNDFQEKIRKSIYKNNPVTGSIINSIVNLARPQRGRSSVDSVITFNFDDILESNLDIHSVKYKVVFKEGIRPAVDELPIYHVHGYIPRDQEKESSEIVFSEDSYHTQFIDPFSWSNLTQLNKLSSTNCLLIGISLSDPNLRRLLDVASRKSPENERNHYLIKRVPKDDGGEVDGIALLLEEQDANGLGLNLIWVQEFSEIPKILDAVASA